jgi:hypothetical protein
MRKLLLALFAMALVVAFTAPSYAASFKFSGFFRLRGISTDNEDQKEDAPDGKQYYDMLIRPRFTVKSGNVTAMWEIDTVVQRGLKVQDNGQVTKDGKVTYNGGNFGGDPRGVRTNRWIIDFAVPGSALRMRVGRSDWTSPDKEIFDSGGLTRAPGLSLYGKLTKNMSLSMFTIKRGGGSKAEADDSDDYLVALGMKLSPALTLTPWVANSRTSKDDGYNYWYGALNAKTKVGILGLNVTGVVQTGELSATQDISAWGFLVRASASLGKMKLRGNLTMLSGDDGSDASDDGRFRTPKNGASGWFQGGHIMTAKYMSFGNALRDRQLGAGAKSKLNGSTTLSGLWDYKVSKTLSLGGGVHVIQSAESATTGDDSKDFGTEIDVNFAWKIYPNLELRGVGGYLAAGDYGNTGGDRDDTWLVGWSLRHLF